MTRSRETRRSSARVDRRLSGTRPWFDRQRLGYLLLQNWGQFARALVQARHASSWSVRLEPCWPFPDAVHRQLVSERTRLARGSSALCKYRSRAISWLWARYGAELHHPTLSGDSEQPLFDLRQCRRRRLSEGC